MDRGGKVRARCGGKRPPARSGLAADGRNDRYWEKKRLNERPIYLRSVVVMLAFVQTFIHLYYDSDRVYRPTSPEMRAADRRPRAVGSPWVQLQASALFLFRQAVFRSVIISVVGPFVYTLFLRRTAWNWMLSLARLFWDMPAVVEMSFMPPYHISLLTRSWGASFFLILLWESSNVIFGAFLAQEPLKKGVPLTDTSPDPNRTLLNGLRAHKGVVKVGLWIFFFWNSSDSNSTSDIRILGTTLHQPALRSQKKVHLRRY